LAEVFTSVFDVKQSCKIVREKGVAWVKNVAISLVVKKKQFTKDALNSTRV